MDAWAGDARDPNPNVIVAVRVRPDNEKEKGSFRSRTVVRALDERVLIFDPADSSSCHSRGVPDHFKRSKDQRYVFDRVFDQYASQTEVYLHTAKGLVDSVMDGYNASIFAYGATGSGKTHTMIGDYDNPGIMPQAMNDLFTRIEQDEDKSYAVSITFLEVYNETLRDLLVEGSPVLELRATSNDCAVVTGLSQHRVACAEEVLQLLAAGNTRRAVSPTEANAVSSRSHAVMQVIVQHKDKTANVQAAVNVGKLSLIDLAGSERACVTQNRGDRMKEGANINKSLLALGNCINALGSGKGKQYVPYRNSKLTRLLKDSLGGNCRTVMIAAVSPSSLCYEDTQNTLSYANRAKNIRSEAKKNVVNIKVHVAEYKKIVTSLRTQITSLKQKLQQLEKEKEELLVSAQASNSLTDQKEQQALEQVLQLIRNNFTERVGLYHNLRLLEEREKVSSASLHKKRDCVAAWDANPNRGATGVFTPPQVAKMREEVSVLAHNIKEHAVLQQGLRRRMEKNMAQYESICNQANQQIFSVHRSRLFAQEQKICHLKLIKRDLHDLNAMKDREIKAQGQRIMELEQLLREQYLLLKANGLVSEQHSRQYTTTTGEVLLTPRRSPTPVAAHRLPGAPIPFCLPLAGDRRPQEQSQDDQFVSLNENLEALPSESASLRTSPYRSPRRPRSILKKLHQPSAGQEQLASLASEGHAAPARRAKKSVKIMTPPRDEDEKQRPGAVAATPSSMTGEGSEERSAAVAPSRRPLQKSPWPHALHPQLDPANDSLLDISVEAQERPRLGEAKRRRGVTLPTPQTPSAIAAIGANKETPRETPLSASRPPSVRGSGMARLMAPTVASSNRTLEKRWRSGELAMADMRASKSASSGIEGSLARRLSKGHDKENTSSVVPAASSSTTKRRREPMLSRKPVRVALDTSVGSSGGLSWG